MSNPASDGNGTCKTGEDQGRPGTFRPGVSGNPRGRPRSGLALTEKIRERVDPVELIDIVLGIARDPNVAVMQRLAAITLLADRGWAKPPAAIEVEPPSDHLDPLVMTPMEREQEIERLLAKREAWRTARGLRRGATGFDPEPLG